MLSRWINVSKSTMRLPAPNPAKKALPWLERFRAANHEEAAVFEAALCEQCRDPRRQLSFRHGGELVEERQDERGVDHHEGDEKRHQQDPRVDPPERAHLLH